MPYVAPSAGGATTFPDDLGTHYGNDDPQTARHFPGQRLNLRSYYLVTDGGRGRASVIPMSAGAPMPEQDFVEVRQGGEEMALKTMVDTLLALPGNRGLIAELDDRPS